MSSAVPEEETTGAAVECDHAGARPGARFCSTCGEAIPAVVVEEPEADPEPEPRHRAQRRVPWHERNPEPEEPEEEPEHEAPRWLAWLRREDAAGWARPGFRVPLRLVLPIAIGAAVIIAAGTVVYFVQDRWFSPEDPARELFAALEAGDGPAVAALLEVDPETHPLLASGALDTGYEAPTGFEVVSVEHDVKTKITPAGDGIGVRLVEDYTQRPDMEHARVTVSYQLGGETFTKELDAVREAGGWFRPWSLNPAPLVTTIIPSASVDGSFQLAGIVTTELGTVQDGLYDAPVSLLALPGVYTVAAQGNALYEGVEETVTVPLGVEETARATTTLRPDAIEGVTAAVQSHIDECAQTGGAPAPECGFREDSGWLSLIRGTPQWDVLSYPEVEVSASSGDDTEWPLEVRTATPGAATITYETAAGGDRTIEVQIYANGYAGVEGGQFEGDAFVFDPQACEIDTAVC
jgi:hypothetical protein